MSFAERLLLRLSRDPSTRDYASSDVYGASTGGDTVSPLELLETVFPDFAKLMPGRTVLDFGCGEGRQSVALARLGTRLVVGIDSNPDTLARAKARLAQSGIETGILFATNIPAELVGGFDVVISKDSMEHFEDPAAVLALMTSALKPDGKLLVTFGPPWYAPYGSHMHFFTKVPWVNLLFSEETVMAVRRRFRDDGARRYEEVESGLNRMTIRRFERLVHAAGLTPSYLRLDCVKRLNFAARLPVLRELMVNQVTAILTRRTVS